MVSYYSAPLLKWDLVRGNKALVLGDTPESG